jgi:PEP-CTERM motif
MIAMRKVCLPLLFGSLTFLAVTPPAKADLVGTSVTGSVQFGGMPMNFFDPFYGYVPAGYLNTAGPTVTISTTATEFGYTDGDNTDTVDFTGNTFTVRDDVAWYYTASWVMTFTDSAFSGLNLVQTSDTFTNGGVSGVLTGDTITLDWAGTPTVDGLLSTSFTLTPTTTPEPSSFVLLGAGILGLVFSSFARLRSQTESAVGS